ncbi:MAG: hypothetical protein IKF05_02370 [Erysipelotrichaceae bacterium]|nr:hypothetical protein [Erysipelotrichaceae bacterium]
MNKEEKLLIFTQTNQYNEHGGFTPAAYQRMLGDILEWERAIHHYTVYRMLKEERCLVMLGMTYEIRKALDPEALFYGRTWISDKKGSILRREIGVYNEEGELLIAAASFFGWVDMKTRRLIREPLKETVEGEKLLQADSRCTFAAEKMRTVASIEIPPSYIDEAGHVTNVRYLEMTYNALPKRKRQQLDRLQRCESFFLRELTREEKVEIRYDGAEDPLYQIIKENGETSFLQKLYFRL